MGAATKLAFAVFLISCCSGGCGGGNYCQLWKCLLQKFPSFMRQQMHVQQGSLRAPLLASPIDWHLQPKFIHVYSINTPKCISVHMTACWVWWQERHRKTKYQNKSAESFETVEGGWWSCCGEYLAICWLHCAYTWMLVAAWCHWSCETVQHTCPRCDWTETNVVSKPAACEERFLLRLFQLLGGHHLKPIMSEPLFVFGSTGWNCVLQGTNLSVLCQTRHKCWRAVRAAFLQSEGCSRQEQEKKAFNSAFSNRNPQLQQPETWHFHCQASRFACCCWT